MADIGPPYITVRIEPGPDGKFGVDVMLEREGVETVQVMTSCNGLRLAFAQARQALWNLEHHGKPFMRAGEVREASGG